MADRVKYLQQAGPSPWDPPTVGDYERWAQQTSVGRVGDAFRDLRIDDRTGNPWDAAWLPHGMGYEKAPYRSFYDYQPIKEYYHADMVPGDWLNPLSIQAGVRNLPLSPQEMMYSSRDEPVPLPKPRPKGA